MLKKATMKQFTDEVKPITPIHIGTGQQIGLLEYKVVRTGDEASTEYFRFLTDRIVAEMQDCQRNQLSEEIESKDLKRIIRYVAEAATREQAQYRLPASPTFAAEYFAKMGSHENQLNVDEMYRDTRTFRPVIPGSSLKGALRTAVVNRLGQNKEMPDGPVKYYENNLLHYDDARNDPFRAVRVTDCLFDEGTHELVGQVFNLKKDFAKMAIFQEQLLGELSDGNATGRCELSIDTDLQQVRQTVTYRGRTWRPLPVEISVDGIVDACNAFYKKNLNNEYDKFYRTSYHQDLKTVAEALNGFAATIDGNRKECLIRLGRYSHVENVTVEKHRRPHGKYGTSRTISEKRYPMGWVRLKFSGINQA